MPADPGSRTFSLIQLIVQSDPDFQAERRRVVEYEFSSGRKFTADTAKRWPYNRPPIEPDES